MESQIVLNSAEIGNGFIRHRSAAEPVEAEERVERLNFTIRIVRSEKDILKAVQIRHASYMRHVPHLGRKLSQPEAIDFEDGVAILLAESKLDGRPLGTMRLQTNQFRPLALEESVTLPECFEGMTLVEAARLGVVQEKLGRVVADSLIKACVMHSYNVGADWLVITARSPLDKRYESLLYEDVFPGRGYIPMHHVGDIPHRVMALDLVSLKERSAKIDHPMYGFIFLTNHPDIHVEHEANLPKYLHRFDYQGHVSIPMNRRPSA